VDLIFIGTFLSLRRLGTYQLIHLSGQMMVLYGGENPDVIANKRAMAGIDGK
jgi:hypothetical protein